MSGAPTSGRFCWNCGASLTPDPGVRTVTRCAVCAELTHLQYLFNQLEQWQADGLLAEGAAETLRERYTARRETLLAPPGVAPKAGRVARPEPPPKPAGPGEWERFREAAGVSWIYAVGVLFVVAGLGWLVAEFGGHAWGRLLLAGIVGLLAATSLRAGWWLLHTLKLRVGGQALLAIGVLLIPATLFALGSALGLPADSVVSALYWIIGAVAAFVLAAAARLASQLALGNLTAALAALELASSLGDQGGAELLGLFLAPLALLNVWLSARVRRLEASPASGELTRAARASAGVMAALASLALLATTTGWWPQPQFGPIATAALLSAALGAIAWETDRSPVLIMAAGAWMLCGYLLDLGGLGAGGGVLAVSGLVFAADRSRMHRERFTLVLTVASLVAALLLVGPGLGDLLAGRASPSQAASGWAVAGVYLAAGLVWQSRRMLWAAVAVAALAVSLTLSAADLGRSQPLGAAALVVAVLAASRRLGQAPWPGGSPARALALAALLPLSWGLLQAAWLAVGPDDPLVALGALALALAGAGVAGVAAEPWAWLPAGGAGLLAVHIAAGLTPLDPGVAAALLANGYLATALWRGRSYRPLELLGTLALVVLVLARPDWWDGRPHLSSAVVSGLAALGLLAPTWPRLALRSTAPELTGWGLRTWLGVFAAAWAGAVVSDQLGAGLGLGAALVAVLVAWVGSSCGWQEAAAAVAALTGFGEVAADPTAANLATLLLCQGAFLVVGGRYSQIAVLAAVQWLLATAMWELARPDLLAEQWLLSGLVQAAVGAAWMARLARSAEAGVSGLLILAVAHGYLGWGLARDHLALWYGLYVALSVLLAWQWRSLGHTRAAGGALALAAVAMVGSAAGAMLAEQVSDALLLLLLDTLLAAGLSRAGSVALNVPVALGNATAAYGLYHLGEPLTLAHFGARLAALCFANVAVAAALRRLPRVVEQVLPVAAVVGICSFAAMLPPTRSTVLGLVMLAGAAFTSAWLTRRPQINDLGFLCAWLAAAMVLFDAAQNGRDELYPYVSLDLYAVPVGLYLLAMVEQRSSESEQVRRTAVLMILGSLLVSAFAATSPVHDAVLFVAVMATVLYGIERGDVLVRYAGVATFAVWVLVQVWRLRSGIGQGLLIALLLALGAGAIAAGLRQEGRSRRAEDEPSD